MVGHRGSSEERQQLFDDLYDQTFSEVLAYCRRRTSTAEDASDAAAEVYVVAWRKLDEAMGAEKPIAWLISVARGIVLNQKRGHGRRTRLFDKLTRQPLGTSVDPAHEAQGNEMVAKVFELLRQLVPLDQEIVALATFEGLSYQEIGEVLDKRPSVIKTRLYRARQRLREDLEQEDFDNGDETQDSSSPGGGPHVESQSTQGAP